VTPQFNVATNRTHLQYWLLVTDITLVLITCRTWNSHSLASYQHCTHKNKACYLPQ